MFAKGRKALGVCDRCGFRFLLNDLKFEYKAGRKTSLKVCEDCMDLDNPRDRPEKWQNKGPERIALKDPRPDPNPTGDENQ